MQVQPRFALVHSHARGQPTEAALAARGRRGGHDAVGDGAPPGHARSAASSSRMVTGRECLAASTARLRPQPRGWHGATPRSNAFRSGTRDPLVTGRKSSSRLPTAWRSPSHGQGEATHTPARPEAAARPGGGRKTRALHRTRLRPRQTRGSSIRTAYAHGAPSRRPGRAPFKRPPSLRAAFGARLCMVWVTPTVQLPAGDNHAPCRWILCISCWQDRSVHPRP